MRATAAVLLLGAALGAHAIENGDSDTASSEFSMARGANAEEQLKQRLRERVRTIPGTDTQYFVGGYVQVDGIATRHKQDGDEQDTFLVSTTPFGPADHDYRLSIRQSQFNWLSRTPTGYGPIWTRLEANLFPIDGTTALTVNQLFVSWDTHVVLGKTYSTFMDDGALPTTLDYNGPGGVTYVRQWLARGSIKVGDNWTLDASVEEPQAALDVTGPVLEVTTDAARPDIVARVRFEADRGHFQFAGLSRRIDAKLASPIGNAEQRVNGSGISVSGSLSLFDDDTLLFQAASGKGIGRYFNDPISATGLAVSTGGSLERVRMSGATAYYQHKWAESWMSVFGASTLWISTDGLRTADSLDRIIYSSANLVHQMTPTLFVGAEALWGEANRVDDSRATNARLQLSLRYLIF